MAMDPRFFICGKCGKKPPDVTSFRYGDEILCSMCWPPEQPKREMKSSVEGTITDIFDDLGPSIQVSLLLKDGGVWTTEADAYPVTADELRKMIGRRIRLTTEMELLDEPAHESVGR